MNVTHETLVGTGRTLIVDGRLLFGFDRVILGDLQTLMGLDATVANEFAALDAPGRCRSVIGATAALDDLSGIRVVRLTIVGRVLFDQELIFNDMVRLAGHIADWAVDEWRHGSVDLGEFIGDT